MIACEIREKNIGGNVAELGVYKGDFSSLINKLFPEKKLYLFDTFEGFREKDKILDIENEYSKGIQDFSDTSVDEVMRKMPNKELCVIKKGYFPETTEGIESTFCFVSIDADLFKPIYEGLVYFYEKMVWGGYIFVHDYNNDEYTGVKAAVRRFCEEQGIPYVPLCDTCGTAVICKQSSSCEGWLL